MRFATFPGTLIDTLRSIFPIFILVISTHSISNEAITIHLAGDSTLSEKDPQSFPETGWGTPFSLFFDENVRVINHAMNGRSSKSFIAEGRWNKLLDQIEKGDYLFIQFGHNDEFKFKGERYSTPEEYKNNLKQFIDESKNAGAKPVLLSSITRRHFDKNGYIELTHPHTPYCVEVAKETGVYFIDMDKISRTHFQEMGEAQSSLRFMHILPDTLPNFPNGVRDDTHLNQLGAREIAQLVLRELKKSQHPLAKRLRKPTDKQLELKYYSQTSG